MAHAIQSQRSDSRATVISINGIGSFDLISTVAMFDGLQQVPGASLCFF